MRAARRRRNRRRCHVTRYEISLAADAAQVASTAAAAFSTSCPPPDYARTRNLSRSVTLTLPVSIAFSPLSPLLFVATAAAAAAAYPTRAAPLSPAPTEPVPLPTRPSHVLSRSTLSPLSRLCICMRRLSVGLFKKPMNFHVHPHRPERCCPTESTAAKRMVVQ